MGSSTIFRCSKCKATAGTLFSSKPGTPYENEVLMGVMEEFNPPKGWDLIIKDDGQKEYLCPKCSKENNPKNN